MMYATKFSMYDLLKTRALDICMDIYSDLGRFIKNIFEEEDTLFKVVTGIWLMIQNKHWH